MSESRPSEFRVELDMFRGPLDLLLYLVRKHELEISTLQLGRIAEQFQAYLEVLSEIDINAVGDFLEVAGLLVEMKSQSLLPRPEEVEDIEGVWTDPREQLVDRLLEYKQFKDAAVLLSERGLQWQQRYERRANDLPPREIAPQDQPIQEIALWDLVSAVGRILKQHRLPNQQEIIYDDTPIHVYVGQIHKTLQDNGQIMFSEMFRPGMHKSSIVGVFLAVLELIRHHAVIAVQEDVHGDIRLVRGETFTEDLDVTKIDTYGAAAPALAPTPPIKNP
ncbi:MAG: segregation/condensation protein A [Planctomycetaceae bacterium]|nr:segregation/condensation protein A [Planctomycetaceae bacterium]